MVSAKTINILGAFFALISFVFLLLVNLGTTVIQSIYIMKYEINNIPTSMGLYGSCVSSNITKNFNLASLADCTKGGLINDFGTSGTKFLGAMHPIGNYIYIYIFFNV